MKPFTAISPSTGTTITRALAGGGTILALMWALATMSQTVRAEGATGAGAGAETVRVEGVIELFTSQGCSSCPPADRLLQAYAQRDDVLALSFHVDYWNYLGWKDTFSSPAFTQRQRNYAVSFNRRGVYTPQVVVNGRTHVVGSRGAEIDGLLSAYKARGKGVDVALNVRRGDGVVHIAATTDRPSSAQATLWLVRYDRARAVDITRGENRGKTITYHNVVRDIAVLGMMKNGVLDINLPAAALAEGPGDRRALLLQETASEGTPGPVVGAARIPAPDA